MAWIEFSIDAVTMVIVAAQRVLRSLSSHRHRCSAHGVSRNPGSVVQNSRDPGSVAHQGGLVLVLRRAGSALWLVVALTGRLWHAHSCEDASAGPRFTQRGMARLRTVGPQPHGTAGRAIPTVVWAGLASPPCAPLSAGVTGAGGHNGEPPHFPAWGHRRDPVPVALGSCSA